MKQYNSKGYFTTDKLEEAIRKDIEKTKKLYSILPRGGYGYDDEELFMSLESRVRRAINFSLHGADTDQYIDPVEEEGSDKWLTSVSKQV